MIKHRLTNLLTHNFIRIWGHHRIHLKDIFRKGDHPRPCLSVVPIEKLLIRSWLLAQNRAANNWVWVAGCGGQATSSQQQNNALGSSHAKPLPPTTPPTYLSRVFCSLGGSRVHLWRFFFYWLSKEYYDLPDLQVQIQNQVRDFPQKSTKSSRPNIPNNLFARGRDSPHSCQMNLK